MDKNLHTVILDPEKCKGCVTCMKRCPTEAIRVRNGKASVLYDRCIGCGECVRLCPHHAKLASYDPFDAIDRFRYRIAIPAPSLYGQFNNLNDVDYVLNGLLAIGFDDVFEAGRAAELVSEATKLLLDRGTLKRPVISTACPAVLELILTRFHNLKDNLLRLLAPVDVAAKLARERALRKGIPAEDIGIFFISPCPAKVAALKSTDGRPPLVDGVLAVSEVYKKLVPVMNGLEKKDLKPLSKMGSMGLAWAASGGEAVSVFRDKYMAADGIENVMHVLNALEDSSLPDIDFIELSACTSGCVGGVLNLENPFVARARLRALRRKMPQKSNSLLDEGKPLEFYLWDSEPGVSDSLRLGEDRISAMGKLIAIENKLKELPLADCGLCGAPSCRAFAEDMANGLIPAGTVCPRLGGDFR